MQCGSSGGVQEKGEREDETQFTTKIGGKTQFGSQLFHLVEVSFPVTYVVMMPYYIETGCSRPLIA